MFLAAMFIASNAAAAARACVVESGGAGARRGTRARRRQATSICARSRTTRLVAWITARKVTRATSNSFLRMFPYFFARPQLAVFQAPIQAQPRLVVVALAPPIVGPPLTILFGNFRN